ncbi:MAG: hypothetical protein M1357_01155 [Candidatus Marsarchaeota archaeon]|nr:hypothetical protein [Candidatus Marsarchaeota archaeon]
MSSSSIVVDDRRNLLAKRRELTARILVSSSDPTPSRKSLINQLAGSIGSSKEQIVIRNIRHVFGSSEVIVRFNVYDTPQHAKAYERPYMFERDLGQSKSRKPEQEKQAATDSKPQAPTG